MVDDEQPQPLGNSFRDVTVAGRNNKNCAVPDENLLICFLKYVLLGTPLFFSLYCILPSTTSPKTVDTHPPFCFHVVAEDQAV